jgi:hypothetical protein
MPQKGGLQAVLTALRRQGVKALAALQREIANKEKELNLLKATEAQWRGLVGAQGKALTFAGTGKARAGALGLRLDWGEILAGLPTTFRTKDVQQKTGKPMEQVYSGVSRWRKDKLIRKNPDGSYQKLSVPAPSQPKKS